MAGRKIFISYKYGDLNVQPLPAVTGPYVATTARHYVDVLQTLLDADDHINKGEKDNESLAEFKDGTIGTKLKDKIYDSSLTIVLLSPNMRNPWISDDDQWIPWEISWSLRDLTRGGRTSGTNAMMAVALPDQLGNYRYAVDEDGCPYCHCTIWQTQTFFGVLHRNMFNRKKPNIASVNCAAHAGTLHTGVNHSFIYPVKWSSFLLNINAHLDVAAAIRDDIDAYELSKTP